MSSNSILHAIIFLYYLTHYVLAAPNIIFVLTDDQDVELKSMQAMPNVMAEVANKGITFNNSYANTPVCCPSRTETVSGRTYHNVKQANVDCQGVSASYNVYQNPNSLFNKFHNNSYITGGFGKLTNNMDFCTDAPDLSSFDRLHVSCNYRDFFTSTNFNKYVGESEGEEEEPTLMNDADIYQTAQLGNATVDFIKEQLYAQRNGVSGALPFIIWVAPYAPHSPAFPAPWHQDRFEDLSLLKTPNYDNDVSNYHRPISDNPPITSEAEEFMLLLYKDRLRSLLAVDDMVLSIVEAVDEYNAWDNTYLVYTSDHGYHIGQYRLPCEKYQPYEETVRIPLYIRGGDIAQGYSTNAMIQNIDFLPTFLDLAGIEYKQDTYDGRSFKTILDNVGPNDYNVDVNWRQTIMFEYHTIKGGTKSAGFNSCAMWCPKIDSQNPFGQTCSGIPDDWILDNMYNNWRVLRIKNDSVNWFYGEFIDEIWDTNALENPIFKEFYDMDNDPYQLTNSYIQKDLDYLTDELLQELHDLVMSYGVCCGRDSCSPIGTDTPGEPAICEGSTSSTGTNTKGGTKGGGGKIKTGKTGKSKANMGVMGMDNYQVGNERFSVKDIKFDISFILSFATIIGIISLVIGVCIGTWIQKRQVVMAMPEKL